VPVALGRAAPLSCMGRPPDGASTPVTVLGAQANPGGSKPAAPVIASADPFRGNEVRVGHADRERVVSRLCDAAGEGRLTLAEAVDREAAAYAARFPRELEALLADLPAEVRPTAPVLAGRAANKGLAQSLRSIILINFITLCVGLSAVPGAAGLVALLGAVTIMLGVVAAENIDGLHGGGRPDGPTVRYVESWQL
jgi:hypothetical protein